MKYFYLLIVIILFLQTLLVLASFVYGYFWQKKRLENNPQPAELSHNQKELQRIKKNKVFQSQMPVISNYVSSLPKLRPLNCANCGGGVLLKEKTSVCPKCETISDLPIEYANAVLSKLIVKKATAAGNKLWRIFDILTRPWVIAVLFCGFILEIFMFSFVMYFDEGVDLLNSILNQDSWALLQMFWLIGLISFAFMLLFLATQSLDIRKTFKVRPILSEVPRQSEVSNCKSCGGAIEYLADEFSLTCDYCNVENFRVKFANLTSVTNRQNIEILEFSIFPLQQHLREHYQTILSIMWVVGGFFTFIFLAFSALVVGYTMTINAVFSIANVICAISLVFILAGISLLWKIFRILMSVKF